MFVTVSEVDYSKALKRAYEEGFNRGKEFNKDEQNLNYRRGLGDGYESGYKDAYEEMYCPNNERERALQEKDFDEGYDQAIDDLVEAGVIGEDDEDYSDEDYSEYKFGAVEDDEDGEEEYCFSKELDKILNGEFASSNNFDENTGEDLDEYNRGYEDGKNRGITIGYNKRDYEYSKANNSDFWAYLKEQDDKLIEDDEKERLMERKHSHYFKDVRHLDYIDVYQVCKLFPIDDDSGAITHARKKLLVAGGRGAGKDMIKDITEARDTLNRYLQIEGIE